MTDFISLQVLGKYQSQPDELIKNAWVTRAYRNIGRQESASLTFRPL